MIIGNIPEHLFSVDAANSDLAIENIPGRNWSIKDVTKSRNQVYDYKHQRFTSGSLSKNVRHWNIMHILVDSPSINMSFSLNFGSDVWTSPMLSPREASVFYPPRPCSNSYSNNTEMTQENTLVAKGSVQGFQKDSLWHSLHDSDLCGTKRTRFQVDPEEGSIMSDSYENYDPNDSCDSDCESELDYCSEEELGNSQETFLDPNHTFQLVRAELSNFAFNNVINCLIPMRYEAPPDDRLPPRKRLKTKNQHQNSSVSIFGGYFHLSCPFYKVDPAKYKNCLRYHDIVSIEDVIQHLRNHHSKPYYCPICKTIFTKVMERDNHVRARECEFQGPKHIEGITETQKTKLLKWDKLYLGEKRRWRRIWNTIFSGDKPCPSPYLEGGVGLTVSMLRDQWTSRHGMELMAQFLGQRGLLCQQEDTQAALEAVHKLVLQDMVEMVLEE